MSAYPLLFSPIRIGSMQLKNRLVMPAMATDYGNAGQYPTRRLLDYLEARARGGVGLITVEVCSVDVRHRYQPHSLSLGDDRFIPAHRQLTTALHAHGVRVQPQVSHPGPESLSPLYVGEAAVGPSVAVAPVTGQACRELPEAEIPAILDLYAEAARRARDAGYDGIELHAAHACMLAGSFLSPLRNRREGRYGAGGAGGLRFLLELVRAMKAGSGGALPLTLRVSGCGPGGRPLNDTQRMAPRLVAAGVDAFHVSGSGADSMLGPAAIAGSVQQDVPPVAAAAAIRRVVEVPVAVVGCIHTPEQAERILRTGDADLVAMGRPLLADPDLPKKARNGHGRRIRRCIGCQVCVDSMSAAPGGEALSCAVNGMLGAEGALHLQPAAERKRVMVIGGGPAGLEAARIASRRGHAVSLHEAGARLGGALNLAALVHPGNQSVLDSLLEGVRDAGVRVRLRHCVQPRDVEREQPDVVIVATGGRATTPRVEGMHLPHVLEARSLAAWLFPRHGPRRGRAPRLRGLGLPGLMLAFARPWQTPARLRSWSRHWLPLGQRVAVVGADLAGVELAGFLAERGRRVHLIECGSELAPEIGPGRREQHLYRLHRLGVVVNSDVQVQRIRRGAIELLDERGGEHCCLADSVILNGRVVADGTLLQRLDGARWRVHAIGDCTGRGLIRKAIRDAAEVACRV